MTWNKYNLSFFGIDQGYGSCRDVLWIMGMDRGYGSPVGPGYGSGALRFEHHIASLQMVAILTAIV